MAGAGTLFCTASCWGVSHAATSISNEKLKQQLRLKWWSENTCLPRNVKAPRFTCGAFGARVVYFPGCLPGCSSSARLLPLRCLVPAGSAALLAPAGPRRKERNGEISETCLPWSERSWQKSAAEPGAELFPSAVLLPLATVLSDVIRLVAPKSITFRISSRMTAK